MPIDPIQYLRLVIQIVRRFKWTFIALFYIGLGVTLEYRMIIVLAPFILLSMVAYFRDKEREERGMEDFRGNWLFFRYGNEIDQTVLPIPVHAEWTAEETYQFSQSLRAGLGQRILGRLPADAVQVLPSLTITDQGSGEKKDFLRVLVRSRFGSMLTHFVHYASFGRTITAHYFVYLRGTHNEWDVVKFVLASPFTIWFWGVPWLLNRHSIISDLSEFRDNSFDGIDLQTMYSLTHQVVIEETIKILEEAGLLTEEVKQAIYYSFNQKISIKGAPGMSMGNVSQAAPAPLRARSA